MCFAVLPTSAVSAAVVEIKPAASRHRRRDFSGSSGLLGNSRSAVPTCVSTTNRNCMPDNQKTYNFNQSINHVLTWHKQPAAAIKDHEMGVTDGWDG